MNDTNSTSRAPEPAAAPVPTAEAEVPRHNAPYRHPGAAPAGHIPCFVLFLLALAWRVWVTVSPGESGGGWIWADAALWTCAAATCIAGLARWMPLQNAIGAGVILVALAALVELVGQQTRFPFGSYVHVAAAGSTNKIVLTFDDSTGKGTAEQLAGKSGDTTSPAGPLGANAPLPDMLGKYHGERLGALRLILDVPWPILFYWVAVLISSRGVARIVLRPWRRYGQYGFWVIALAAVLSLWLAWGGEMFFVKVAASKLWLVSPDALLRPVPWTFYVSWLVTSILALTFVAPWMILKPPVKVPTDMHPVVVWLLLAGLFLLGCALKNAWPPAIGMMVAIPLVGFLALRGRTAAVLPPPGER